MLEKGKKFILFMVGFALCTYLISSINNVAWVFRLFEPSSPLLWNFFLFQVDARDIQAYAQAIGIDVLTSMLIAFCLVTEKKKATSFLIVITGILVVYSVIFNFVYTERYSPTEVHNLWNIPILFGLTTTGYLIPLMVSAYPFFILTYTFIAILVRGVRELSIEELRAKSDRLEQVQKEKERLATLKRNALRNSVTGFLDTASDIMRHTRASTSGKPSDFHSTNNERGSSDIPEPERKEPETEPLVLPLEPPIQVPVDVLSRAEEPLPKPEAPVPMSLDIPEPLSELNGHSKEEPVEKILVGNEYLPIRRKRKS